MLRDLTVSRDTGFVVGHAADFFLMSVDAPRLELDQRQGWARVCAAVACLTGIGVIALSASMLALIVLAGLARFWTWLRDRDIDSAGIWGIATESALAAGAIAVVSCCVIAFWWFWTGSVDAVITEVNATRVGPTGATEASKGRPSSTRAEVEQQRRTLNLLEELSLGLGRPVPELWVTSDETPNALSMRSTKRRVVCITAGVGSLSRGELEAMLAHEMGHLWAHDSHWVTSGMVAIARARRAGMILLTTGAVMLFLLLGAAWEGAGILWSTMLFALALMVLGSVCTPLLRRLEMGMRRHADELADVAAVKLARNPGSLAALCAGLAEDERSVRAASWRSELLWFEMVEAADLTGETDPEAPLRTRRELVERARAAYAEAGEPVPEKYQLQFDAWLAKHAEKGG